ncbi:MAG TPA: Gfo/Idh/MocA family oxidoreductase, partial [Candidatus Methylacidiphilales bacterium]|nr:Gfo/Idh/MocA family oxidoreductase [Candidatus Methylacidiphilales bacterium]
AGGELRYVYDPDPRKVENFLKTYPSVKAAPSLDAILDDPEVKLVAAAAVPNLRGPLGIKVMEAGKDYFTDKTPFTTLDQLDAAKEAVAKTGKKYAVYFSERLHVECAMYAGELIDGGAIGKVVQVLGLGPHRLGAAGRPSWFFNKEQYGGILCDIGSHQIEQFLTYSGATDADVASASVANFANPDYPELEDFGQANLIGNNGATNHFRVDWFTPAGLGTWGDGRTIILGTKGYIELRKYIDVARDQDGNQLYLVNEEGTQHMSLTGKVGYPYFGRLILDCLNRTETAMTQEHAFKAAELCIRCQLVADASKATA